MSNSPYNTQYTPNAISNNPIVNSMYQWGTNALDMGQSPGYVMGQRPSDTFFVVNGGSKRNQKASESLAGHINVMASLRKQGGQAGEWAESASKLDGAANAYLGQIDTVRQATGGNLDQFSRRMIGGATEVAGLGNPSNHEGANSWQKQKAFHTKSIEKAKSFGKKILDRAYKGGDAFNVDKDFTRDFEIEEIADVVSQLGYEGKVRWDNDDEQNMNAVDDRVGKLAAARNVFGDGDANTLQKKTEMLLGSSVGSNDETSGKILQQISAEAKVLNKDVENMVKSREVIKNTLIAINKSRDSRGNNLTHDGTGSVSGDLEFTANRIGSIIDHATDGLPAKEAEKLRGHMAKTMIKDQDSDAGQMMKLMQSTMMAGDMDEKDYNQAIQAMRAGDTEAATKIARRTVRDFDKNMNDKVLFENTIGWNTKKGINRKKYGGDVDKYQADNKEYTDQRVDAVTLAADYQTTDRIQQKATRRRMQDMDTVERMTGVKRDESSDAEKVKDYKKDLDVAAQKRAQFDRDSVNDSLGKKKITQALADKQLEGIDETLKQERTAINKVEGDNIKEVRDTLKTGKAGLSITRASKITNTADINYVARESKKYFKKVKDSGSMLARAQLDSLKEHGAVKGSEVQEILKMEDKDERDEKIEGLIKEKFKDDEAGEAKFRDATAGTARRRTNMYLDHRVQNADRAGVVSVKRRTDRRAGVEGMKTKIEKQGVTDEAIVDEENASKNLGHDKNNAEKLVSGITKALVKALEKGAKDNGNNYDGNGALRVVIENPNEIKPDKDMTQDGGG